MPRKAAYHFSQAKMQVTVVTDPHSAQPHLGSCFFTHKYPGMSEQQPVPRRSHRKSRTGCRNCKERRVKVSDPPEASASLTLQCDEARPVCRRCLIHYDSITVCEYPSDSRSQTTDDESRSLARQPAEWSVIDSVLSDPPASEGELTEVMKYCE